jgi:hypothetical protein
VLAPYKGLELLGLGVALGKHKVATLAIVEVGAKLLCEGWPAPDRLAGEGCLGGVLPLAADTPGAGPRGRWLTGDQAALNNKDAAALARGVVGDRAAKNPAADDQDIN